MIKHQILKKPSKFSFFFFQCKFLIIWLNYSLDFQIVCCLLRRNMSMDNKPIESSIKLKIENALKPSYFEIINESYMHNVSKGSETHFKVLVVSNEFDNKPLIKRHRIINELLEDELKNGVHALSIVVSNLFC